jgi:hypothetical protein
MRPDLSETSAVERIARVLAGWRHSANADGMSLSASPEVEGEWPFHVDTAVALLKTLREPDADIADAGDGALWTRMVDAAIAAQGRSLPTAADSTLTDLPPIPKVRNAGEQGGPWSRADERSDESFPASDPPPASPGVD